MRVMVDQLDKVISKIFSAELKKSISHGKCIKINEKFIHTVKEKYQKEVEFQKIKMLLEGGDHFIVSNNFSAEQILNRIKELIQSKFNKPYDIHFKQGNEHHKYFFSHHFTEANQLVRIIAPPAQHKSVTRHIAEILKAAKEITRERMFAALKELNKQLTDQNQLKLVPQSTQDDSHIAELTLKTIHDQEPTIESEAKFKKEYEKYIAHLRFPVTVNDILFDICLIEYDGGAILVHKNVCQKKLFIEQAFAKMTALIQETTAYAEKKLSQEHQCEVQLYNIKNEKEEIVDSILKTNDGRAIPSDSYYQYCREYLTQHPWPITAPEGEKFQIIFEFKTQKEVQVKVRDIKTNYLVYQEEFRFN